jgi:uncharacterized OB-fold protein
MLRAQSRPIPPPAANPETRPFWDAAAAGKLLVKRCTACGAAHHYPRARCPFCGSERTEWTEASGLGTVYSYSVFRHGPIPYAIAYVTLEEGVTLMTNLGSRLATNRPGRTGRLHPEQRRPAGAHVHAGSRVRTSQLPRQGKEVVSSLTTSVPPDA